MLRSELACLEMKSIISASAIPLPGFLTMKAMGICPASSSGYLLSDDTNEKVTSHGMGKEVEDDK